MLTESIDSSSSSLRKSVYVRTFVAAFSAAFLRFFGSTSHTATTSHPVLFWKLLTWPPPWPPVPITAWLIVSLGENCPHTLDIINGATVMPAPVVLTNSRRVISDMVFSLSCLLHQTHNQISSELLLSVYTTSTLTPRKKPGNLLMTCPLKQEKYA